MNTDRHIAVAVKNLANQFRRYLTAMKLELETEIDGVARLTDIQGRILSYLFEQEGLAAVYQRDIEKQFNIRRSTATNILNRIERHGFIRRTV